ncbi:hypothetical protein GpartN1_g2518.t1 [Galdieria partita]|uniref:Methylmalonyl-CoA epimerase, mitochondrial n=1 Tax=Galdieria partita TaxID=83374 RepID=A0A9C7PSR6_9RHOD|nr:hypothetical protein GpartN1_g1380.t1 [Galdieria partita]GJQ10727.1 hypothetical protein GpartN1_g2518.t1 [Galdieria partita]
MLRLIYTNLHSKGFHLKLYRYHNRKFTSSEHPSKIGALNHVAVAVNNLQKAADYYREALGATVSEPQKLPDHGVTVVFVRLGNTNIELLEPLGNSSPISKFLENNKSGGLHHICLEVENIHSAMQRAKNCGIRCLTEEPRIGAHGKPVVFLHPKDCNGVLTELEQK